MSAVARAQMIAHRPADDPAAEEVHDGGEIQPADDLAAEEVRDGGEIQPADTSWLREPTTGVHSFGGGSSIHQPVQFPVKLSQLLSYSGDEVSALTAAPD